MKCPRCGATMAIGTPHVTGTVTQYECRCGKVVVVQINR